MSQLLVLGVTPAACSIDAFRAPRSARAVGSDPECARSIAWLCLSSASAMTRSSSESAHRRDAATSESPFACASANGRSMRPTFRLAPIASAGQSRSARTRRSSDDAKARASAGCDAVGAKRNNGCDALHRSTSRASRATRTTNSGGMLIARWSPSMLSSKATISDAPSGRPATARRRRSSVVHRSTE